MSSEAAIRVDNLGKCYHIYGRPQDRLKQFVLPRLQRLALRKPKTYFQEFWALKDVSFEVPRGETFGIIGRNGSGKSTLLQIICGTVCPSAGTVETKGRVAALLELGSGFNPEFTGRENVYMATSLYGLGKEETDARFDAIAAFADIGDFIEQPVKTYSSGMFVRLAFAVIAHVDADILAIDEALAVGDAYFTQKCMRFLRKFRENGTLIFVSHDLGAVTGLCDNALWLERGRARLRGTAKDVVQAYLAAFYSDAGPATDEAAAASPSPAESGGSTIIKDARKEMIDRTNLRNDIEIFEFTPGLSKDFGQRGAEIRNVSLRDAAGQSLSHVVGSEPVKLRIEAAARQSLQRPIIGFLMKDRLGQNLFGDNTYLTTREKWISAEPGEILTAEFAFQMPILPAGDYSIAAAIATGTQEDHVQHHWIHDALLIRSVSSSVCTGLVGVPMQHINLSIDKTSPSYPQEPAYGASAAN